MNIVNDKPLVSRKKLRCRTAILGGDVSADSQTLFLGCMDGVYEFDIRSGKDEKIDTHESYVSSVCITDNKQIVSAGYDGNIQWFDVENQKRVRRVSAHQFWSWQMALSSDNKLIASVTGQYLAGDYDYKPAAEVEPSIQVFEANTGKEVASFPHVPSVQAVALSPDSRYVAAGNLMGEIRVYEVESKTKAAQWTTPDFTSWGVIKSHCYIGGIYALKFSNDGQYLYAGGMGKMRDPMAGNGRQLWQKFDWKQGSKVDETHQGESGEGLMETLAMHPAGRHFVMAGRLRGGSWNAGLFEVESGKLVQSLKTGCRITHAVFNSDGTQLFLLGGQGQPKQREKIPKFGRIDIFDVKLS